MMVYLAFDKESEESMILRGAFGTLEEAEACGVNFIDCIEVNKADPSHTVTTLDKYVWPNGKETTFDPPLIVFL